MRKSEQLKHRKMPSTVQARQHKNVLPACCSNVQYNSQTVWHQYNKLGLANNVSKENPSVRIKMSRKKSDPQYYLRDNVQCDIK